MNYLTCLVWLKFSTFLPMSDKSANNLAQIVGSGRPGLLRWLLQMEMPCFRDPGTGAGIQCKTQPVLSSFWLGLHNRSRRCARWWARRGPRRNPLENIF